MAIKFEELKDGEIILFLTSAKKYLSTNLELLEYYINKQKSYCVYVTVNRPYTALMKIFQDNAINTNKIFVIDAITPVSSGKVRANNAVFVGSPQELTNISISATSAINSMPKGNRLLFFDTLSTLSVYNDEGSVTKFIHFIINKMREWYISGAIISMEKETDDKMLTQLSQFCDKVIEVK